MTPAILTLFLSLSPAAVGPEAVPWNAQNAEHLLNRAGFGARSAEIDAAVAAGLDATIERLLTPSIDWEMPSYERIVEPAKKDLEGLSKEEQDKQRRVAREADRRQMLEATAWWFREMETTDAPLQEKMVLFWHGLFTTSIEEAKRSFLVLQQHEFLRRNALGNYADLLRGIARDPGMLVYLDNNVNRKGAPNENFARELMELFSLGEGNYTEEDVKEAARALTGRGSSRDGNYEFRSRQHDAGEKTVLGVTGKLDGDQLVDILLKQDACPRWIARRLITWFEGVEPQSARLAEYARVLRAERYEIRPFLEKLFSDPRFYRDEVVEPESARLAEYARVLRAERYEIRPFLEKLFSDPRFYRDEVVGARVLGPVEYMVGTARRTQIEVPAGLLGAGAALLGQRVFSPPSVKGWDEGYAWITTSTLMQRGNLAGLMLGVVKVADVMSMADVEAEMAAEAQSAMQDEGGMQSDSTDEPGMRPMTGEAGPGTKTAAKPAVKPKTGKAGGYAMEILRRIEGSGWYPIVNFRVRLERADARTDAQIVDRMLDDLLAIPAPADTRERMRAFLAGERKERKIAEGQLLETGGEAERILRRMAHLILSLPEAQLG